jgi:hypothetical protein
VELVAIVSANTVPCSAKFRKKKDKRIMVADLGVLVSQSIISQWYKKFFGSAMLSYQS